LERHCLIINVEGAVVDRGHDAHQLAAVCQGYQEPFAVVIAPLYLTANLAIA
jgi:hypothetical protein